MRTQKQEQEEEEEEEKEKEKERERESVSCLKKEEEEGQEREDLVLSFAYLIPKTITSQDKELIHVFFQSVSSNKGFCGDEVRLRDG